MKRLYRAREQQMIGGVCAGIANYFGIDVTLVRLAWVVVGLAGGIGLPAYVIAWIIIPEEPGIDEPIDIGPEPKAQPADTRVLGLILIAIGAYFLIREIFPWIHLRPYFWPLIIIAAGVMLLSGGLWGGKK
ncbi:MAG: PspC domain-containing protein [Firmicutes bacterium]|nr:PspC domain-containing protein [Bacillota bacterium]